MRKRSGLSVVEMIVVLAILASLASVVLPLFSGIQNAASATVTQSSLCHVRDAVAQYWLDTKSTPLDGVLTFAEEAERFQIRWLFRNPVTNTVVNDFQPATQVGWNGPYLLQATGSVSDFGPDTLVDAWNHPLVIQDVSPSAAVRDVRIVSPGPNGVIDIPSGIASVALTAPQIGDDLYVAISFH